MAFILILLITLPYAVIKAISDEINRNKEIKKQLELQAILEQDELEKVETKRTILTMKLGALEKQNNAYLSALYEDDLTELQAANMMVKYANNNDKMDRIINELGDL